MTHQSLTINNLLTHRLAVLIILILVVAINPIFAVSTFLQAVASTFILAAVRAIIFKILDG